MQTQIKSLDVTVVLPLKHQLELGYLIEVNSLLMQRTVQVVVTLHPRLPVERLSLTHSHTMTSLLFERYPMELSEHTQMTLQPRFKRLGGLSSVSGFMTQR
jgi:hypothetical protein